MPCDQVRTTQVAIEAADVTLLAEGLKAIGCTVNTLDVDRKRLTFTDRNGYTGSYAVGKGVTVDPRSHVVRDSNQVRRAYSEQVVRSMAKKFRWTVKQAPAANDKQVRLLLQKRRV